MVNELAQLGPVNHINDFGENNNLQVSLNENSDKLERELILKQLLFLRQDVNDLKQISSSR